MGHVGTRFISFMLTCEYYPISILVSFQVTTLGFRTDAGPKYCYCCKGYTLCALLIFIYWANLQ